MVHKALKSIALMAMVVCAPMGVNAENVNELNPAVEEVQVFNPEMNEGIPVDGSTLATIHAKCEEARAWFEACQVNEYDYDVRYYDVRNRKTGAIVDQCPIQWGRKNGLYARILGTYEYNTAGKHNFGGGAGIWLQNRYYALEFNMGFTTYVYNSNSLAPGKREKMLFGEGAVYGCLPLDRCSQWRLNAGVGLILNHYKTASKPVITDSEYMDFRHGGNSLKPLGAISLSYRPFASRFMFSIGMKVYETPSVFQNAETKHSWTFRPEVGFSVNLGKTKAFQKLRF